MTRAAALAAVLAAGCAVQDPIATGDGVASCAGDGAAPRLADGTCPGDLAAALFRHAVCGCGLLSTSAPLATDGFDSRIAPYAPGGLGGAVGGDLGLDAADLVTVGGDLTIAGDGLDAGAILEIAGDLACGGPLGRPSSAITVGGAARIAGDVDVARLEVAGTLTTAPGATVTGDVTAGATATAAITVPPPCRCDELDVAATIAAHAAQHDGAAIDLAPDALADVAGDATVELPCGRFYLDRIQGTGAGTVTVRAVGRAVLFVAGNITLAQDLAVELAPGAELDLFVGGNVQTGALRLGDPARPAALRVYVAAAGSIAPGDAATIAANLYAPDADLALAAPLEVFGALVVHQLAGGGALTVHFDRAIAAAGDACD